MIEELRGLDFESNVAIVSINTNYKSFYTSTDVEFEDDYQKVLVL